MVDVQNLCVASVVRPDGDTPAIAAGLLTRKSDGAIQLTCGLDTIGCGLDLDPDQAARVVDRIVKSYPKIGPRS